MPTYRRYLLGVFRDQSSFGEVPIKLYLRPSRGEGLRCFACWVEELRDMLADVNTGDNFVSHEHDDPDNDDENVLLQSDGGPDDPLDDEDE